MAETSTSISIFYTQDIAGDLDFLPRLHTVLKQLRAEAPGLAYTVDLGGACAPHIWHCEATSGRSTLMALDGLGYVAANAAALDESSFTRMRESPAAIALIDATHTYAHSDVLFALEPTRGDGHLCVILTPARATRLDGLALSLAAVEPGQVGMARLVVRRGYHLVESRTVPVPHYTAPDPTIAGVVDFVVGEAKYYQKRMALKAAQSAARRALADHLAALLEHDLHGLRELFTRFASQPHQWEAAKQLGFLLSRAANEDSDTIKITADLIMLQRGPSLIASVRPQGAETITVMQGLIAHDAVLGEHLHIIEHNGEKLTLRLGRPEPE